MSYCFLLNSAGYICNSPILVNPMQTPGMVLVVHLSQLHMTKGPQILMDKVCRDSRVKADDVKWNMRFFYSYNLI